MPKLTIPKSKKYSVGYEGDYFNDIVSSFNTDFSKHQSRITPSLRMYPHSTSDTISGLTLPTSLLYGQVETSAKYYLVADQLYSTANYTTTAFAAVGGTNAPTGLTDSDIVANWKNTGGYKILLCSTSTDIAKFEGAAGTASWDKNFWTTTLSQSALTSGIEHPMANFVRYVLIGDGYKLHSILLSAPGSSYVVNGGTGVAQITFPDGYIINWIKCTKNRVFIGLRSEISDTTPSLVCEYDLVNNSSKVLEIQEGRTTGFVWNDNLHIVNKKGGLGEYTGTGFRYYAWFPCYFIDGLFLNLPHRNGIEIVDGKPHFLIYSTDYDYYQSGVWVYEPAFERLYLKYSLSNTLNTLLDYGTSRLSSVGTLNIINTNAKYFFAGATFYKTATTTVTGLFTTYPMGTQTTNRCQFVYSKVPTNELSNRWNRLGVQYSDYDVGTLSGSIVAKYRIEDQSYANSSSPVTATWVTSTTFTIASSDLPSGVVAGDEVFILAGQGAGATAHISSITGTTTKTITIDEAILTSPSGTFNPIFSNFKKLPTGTYEKIANKTYQIDFSEDCVCEWLQIKLEVRGNLQVESLQVGYNINTILDK
jgi:hypothetical protein